MDQNETTKYWITLDKHEQENIRWRFFGDSSPDDWASAPHETSMDCIHLLDHGYVALLNHMGTDIDIVNAARKSFNRESKYFDEKDLKLLSYLWSNKHSTPFEMVEFKFAVKSPLIVSRQWMRHRTWSYNEVSRRYTDEDLRFYTPINDWIRRQSKSDRQASVESEFDFLTQLKFANIEEICENMYNELLKEGVCREQARLVLPQSMYTEFIAKVNLWNLLHFIKVRSDEHAQWEMRQYAEAIVEMISNIVPETMKLFLEENNGG